MPNTGGWQRWQTVTKAGLSLSAGAHVIRLVFDAGTTENGGVGNYNWLRLTAAAATSTPYGGTPAAVPGTVQIENFDEGGSGVAYLDTTSGNSGGRYRATDVDIDSTTDTGSGYNVGSTRPGEWLEYSVSVASAGTYALEVRVASVGTGARFHVEIDGVDSTGAIGMPNTGGWQRWQTVTKAGVSLSAGAHVIRLVFDAGTTENGGVGNYNWLRLTTAAATSTPYGGTPAALPGTVQIENFDEGGSGVAYLDTTSGNSGGRYRATDVDIDSTTDTGAGYNVGSTRPGEWLEYLGERGECGHVRAGRARRKRRNWRAFPPRDRWHRPHGPLEHAKHGGVADVANGDQGGAVAHCGCTCGSTCIRYRHLGERGLRQLQLDAAVGELTDGCLRPGCPMRGRLVAVRDYPGPLLPGVSPLRFRTHRPVSLEQVDPH